MILSLFHTLSRQHEDTLIFNKFQPKITDSLDVTFMRVAYEDYMREQTELYWRNKIAQENKLGETND